MKKLVLVVILMAGMPVALAEPLDDVLSCMRANLPRAAQVRQIELLVGGLDGEQMVLRGRAFLTRQGDGGADGPVRAMLRIDEPMNLNGAAYLLHQTADFRAQGMYVYLPGVRRVRRITGAFADGRLFGSNISYFDFQQMIGSFGDFRGELGSDAMLSERPVRVLRFVPREDALTPYTSVQAWVDRATCLPLQVDFLVDGVPRKRLLGPVSAITRSGARWYLGQIEMIDMIDDTRTVLRMADMAMSEELSARYFDPHRFYEVR